jgi:hypothetical protein
MSIQINWPSNPSRVATFALLQPNRRASDNISPTVTTETKWRLRAARGP